MPSPNPWNDLLLPAGLLREPLAGMRRAQVVFIVGGEDNVETMLRDAARVRETFAVPDVFPLVRRLGPWVNAANGVEAQAPQLSRPQILCAIARPERFIGHLESSGIDVSEARVFADHHHYTERDIENVCVHTARTAYLPPKRTLSGYGH